jgi:hypothetical protein
VLLFRGGGRMMRAEAALGLFNPLQTGSFCRTSSMNYYEILGVPVDSSTEEIQQAYRATARKVHPDLNREGGRRAEDRMKQLNEIRDTLTDPLLRSAYDANLVREGEHRRSASQSSGVTAESGPYAGRSSFGATGPSGHRRAHGLMAGLILFASAIVVVAALVSRTHYRPTTIRRDPRPPLEQPVQDLAQVKAAEGTRRAQMPVPPPKSGSETTRVSLPATKPSPGQKGLVKIGSTVAEVIRLLGPPDRTEPGSRPGNVFMIYGQLKLELRNGEVVGGGF